MAWGLTQKLPASPTQHERELTPFSDAASRVYMEVTGNYLPLFGDTAALLNHMAQAIAQVVPIYGARRVNETLKPLAATELQHGSFERGATLLRTSTGIEYPRLFIRTAAVQAAVGALKALSTNPAPFAARPKETADGPAGLATSMTESRGRGVLVLASKKKSRRT